MSRSKVSKVKKALEKSKMISTAAILLTVAQHGVSA
jgi:hypothetical protein